MGRFHPFKELEASENCGRRIQSPGDEILGASEDEAELRLSGSRGTAKWLWDAAGPRLAAAAFFGLRTIGTTAAGEIPFGLEKCSQLLERLG